MKTQNEVLEDLKAQIEHQKKYVSEVFYYQTEEKLTTKKTENQWSAAQCFEHLNLCNAYYISEINEALPKLKSTQSDQKYKAGPIGAYMIKSMQVENGVVKNKMKTFKNVRPLAEREPGATVKAQPVFTDFFADLDTFQSIVLSLYGKNIQSAKVKSLIGNIFRFKVGDALLFLLAHNDRHIQQAIRALEDN